ncbi:MAG: 6-phosphogluconolactonase [Castellaniella sp.]|uniref:6-phosphogluconolactonase n=1 Tax=Castellaniella sp. TaxID=1955812 RepID=UPI003C767A03
MTIPIWRMTDGPASQAHDLAAVLTTVLADAVNHYGEACLAVSGGRSPRRLFDVLSRANLPWSRIQIVLVDERCAPASPEDRNETLVRRHLLAGPAAAACFTPPLDGGTPIPVPLRIDALVLGIGTDGHTASLFPEAPELPDALNPERPPAYVFVTPPTAPWRRITFNLAAILAAKRLFITLSGAEKRAVLEQAMHAGLDGPPIGTVMARATSAPEIHWCP